MTHNLIKRGHSWSVRYIIPTRIRAKIGKSEIVRALGTRDLDEARKLKHAVLANIIEEVVRIAIPMTIWKSSTQDFSGLLESKPFNKKLKLASGRF